VEWWANLRMKWRGLWRGEDVHREIAEEWEFHVEKRAEENVRRGMSAADARASAERSFGNAGYIKDVSWDERGGGVVETLWQDLRFGWRQLQEAPGFTFVALVSLALGIGANAVIFTLISTVLLRPLPIAHPQRVFAVHQIKQRTSDSHGAGSAAFGCMANDRASRDCDDRGGSGNWPGVCVRRVARVCEYFVRSERDRYGYVCGDFGAIVCGGVGGLFCAGAAGYEGGSGDCDSESVIETQDT
jgi:hypothetical protein